VHARLTPVFALLLLAVFALPAGSQDDKPKNLKVLPKDTSEDQIHTIMRGYAGALGVGCDYCHVRNADHSFEFDKDDKRAKLVARDMMRMTMDINAHVLANLKDRPAPAVNVECMTCHRGLTRPRMLGDVIVDSLNTGGLDSARTAYARLRAKYYGRASYDFGEPSLVGTALKLSAAGKYQAALDVLKLNAEQYPNSANTVVNVGDVHIAMGDTAAALNDYRAAAAMDSTNMAAKFRLKQYGPKK
jgi:tetratricopeptide (TPR) repeat protein